MTYTPIIIYKYNIKIKLKIDKCEKRYSMKKINM